jgi:hypothetical protein
MLDVLSQQLDLERVPVGEGITVYRNLAWASSRSVLPAREGDRTEPFDSAGDDLREAQAAMKRDVGVDGAEGEIPATGDLLIASTSDPGWKVRIDGAATRRTETYGWANQFGAGRTGEGTLAYETPLVHRAIDLGLVVAWVLALWAWRRARRRARERDRTPLEPVGAATAGAAGPADDPFDDDALFHDDGTGDDEEVRT